jgi:hypothetical protein
MLALLVALAVLQDPVDAKIDDFAKKLPGGETALRDTLLSKPGKVALKEALAALAVELRDEARKSIVPDFFKARLDENGRLKDPALAERWLKELDVATSDLKELKEKAVEFAAKIADEPAANVQIKKAIQQEGILGILYVTQLRVVMGRDDAKAEQVVMQRLGGFLVPDMEGKLVVREDVKEQLETALTDLEKRRGRVDILAKGLAKFAEGLKDDGINGKIKKAFATPAAAIAIVFKDKDSEPEALLAKLDESFADGELLEERTATAEKILTEIDKVARRLEAFRGALDRIAARMKEEKLRELFKHDFVRLALLGDVNATAGSARTIAEAFEIWIRTLFVEEDGTFRLNDEARGRVTEGLRKAQVEVNQLKRAMATVSEEAKKIAEDDKAKVYFTSPVGQMLLLDSLKAAADALRISDAQSLEAWIARHFEEGAVRDESRSDLNAIIEKAAKIRKQLENNDIPSGDK